MKIDIRPSVDQIRFFARSAMRAWDYQDSKPVVPRSLPIWSDCWRT
jgi:hypothetical protein